MLSSVEVLTVFKQFVFLDLCYADDLQLYDHAVPSESMSVISRLSDCVEAVKAWMAASRLCFNPSKTELIWLGASRYVQVPDGPTEHSWCVCLLCQTITASARLGRRILDSECHLRHMTLSATSRLSATSILLTYRSPQNPSHR